MKRIKELRKQEPDGLFGNRSITKEDFKKILMELNEEQNRLIRLTYKNNHSRVSMCDAEVKFKEEIFTEGGAKLVIKESHSELEFNLDSLEEFFISPGKTDKKWVHVQGIINNEQVEGKEVHSLHFVAEPRKF